MKTQRKQEIYEFIVKYMLKNMYSPTIREIMDATGIQSTSTVHYHLEKMADEGLIIMSDYNSKFALAGYKLVKDD